MPKGKEHYETIDRFPAYRIGSDGSVWTRFQKSGVPRGKRLLGEWKQLKQASVRGYKTIALVDVSGSRKSYKVHRLVLEAFVGSCPEGMQGCHGDGNRQNNSLDNLRWDTAKSNCNDRNLHGSTVRGEACGNSKLTSEHVVDIRRRLADGEDVMSIAVMYSVTREAIYAIRASKTWRHVG